MKKFLLLTGLIGLLASNAKADVFATNILTSIAGGGSFTLITNRASVYSIEISTAVSSGALVKFYDADIWTSPIWGTNYTNASYVTRIVTNSYTSVSNYIGYNGVTNWYTNIGVFTATVTNSASTNELPVIAAFAVAGGTYTINAIDALFARGISVAPNTNVSIIIYYRPAR